MRDFPVFSLSPTVFRVKCLLAGLPQGKAKFVDRGTGRGPELGFLVETRMDKLDVSKLPAKYKRVEQHGEYTIGPTETVVYTAHLEFLR
jgi:hypothetical protein